MSENKKTLLDWIDCKARSWGHVKRRLLMSEERYPESFSGKLVEEGPGASLSGHKGRGSRDTEVFTGDALEVAMAVHKALEAKKLSERQYTCFFAHYVIRGPVKQKAHDLDVSVGRYYELLATAHHNLAAVMNP